MILPDLSPTYLLNMPNLREPKGLYISECSWIANLLRARYSPTDEHAHPRSNSSISQPYERATNQSSHYRLPQLFEPTQPQFPQRNWMPQFIQLFITHMGGQCPFLTYEDLCDRLRRQTMTSLMANCIAALGARYIQYWTD